MKEKYKAIVGTAIFILVVVAAMITVISIIHNDIQLKRCRYGPARYSSTMQYNIGTIYVENLIFDTCYLIENGDELTFKEYKNKHKYDGIEVRRR